MCALENCQRVVVPTEHAGRRRVELEILGVKRRFLIGPRESVERIKP